MKFTVSSAILVSMLLGCPQAIAEGVAPFGEVLLWHASEETSSVWSSTVSASSFSAENVGFGWEPGFRVGLAREPAEGGWDARLSWTYFHTSADAAVPPGAHAVVPEFFSGFVSGDAFSFDSASLNWSLVHHVLCLEAGRKTEIGESAWIRPSFGISAAAIDLDVRLDLAGSSGRTATERVQHQFRGVGPSFSINAGWEVAWCRPLSLVGSLSVDFLYGTWNVDDTYRRTSDEPAILAYQSFTTSMRDSCLGTPVLRYFVGFQWARQGTLTVTGRIGYELQWWANQQRMPTFQQLPMHGDLTLQGLTCGGSVLF